MVGRVGREEVDQVGQVGVCQLRVKPSGGGREEDGSRMNIEMEESRNPADNKKWRARKHEHHEQSCPRKGYKQICAMVKP